MNSNPNPNLAQYQLIAASIDYLHEHGITGGTVVRPLLFRPLLFVRLEDEDSFVLRPQTTVYIYAILFLQIRGICCGKGEKWRGQLL